MKPIAVAGVDVGQQGAFVVIDSNRELLLCKDMPKSGNKHLAFHNPYAIFEIAGEVQTLQETHDVHVVIESPTARPYEKGQRIFNFGKGVGLVQMAFVARGFKPTWIMPHVWEPVFNVVGKTNSGWDQTLYDTVISIFGTKIDRRLFTKRGKFLDGRADALLISEYGMRELT